VRAYSPDGRVLREIAGDALAEGGFSRPMGIALDAARGTLVVSDLAGRLARIPLASRVTAPLSARPAAAGARTSAR
jgi:hypothetical protein